MQLSFPSLKILIVIGQCIQRFLQRQLRLTVRSALLNCKQKVDAGRECGSYNRCFERHRDTEIQAGKVADDYIIAFANL